jgi:hypothetical protein
MALQDLRGNFASAVSHLATTIQMNAALTPDNRNISGVNSGHGRGRNAGHGRNNGRGGRGQGRGRGNLYLGTYSPAQWRAFSAEDRKKISDDRKRSADQQSQGQGQGIPGVYISQITMTPGQEQDA